MPVERYALTRQIFICIIICDYLKVQITISVTDVVMA
jgi:hypothetical protein